MIVGIDPSSMHLACTVVRPKMGELVVAWGKKYDLRKPGKGWEPQGAGEILYIIEHLFNDSIGLGPDDVVWLEEPVMGKSVRPTIVQSYVSGMVQGTVARTGARIHLVNNKTWKKVVVGNGNASKEDTTAFLKRHFPSCVRICGADQDLYDAAGLAIYGAATEVDS